MSTAANVPFAFELNQKVAIKMSDEVGTVRARAEWSTGNISYFVAYTSKQGEYREAWIDADLLEDMASHQSAFDKAIKAVVRSEQRGVEPEFLAAVSAAISKINPHSTSSPHHIARTLIVNKEIAVVNGNEAEYIENPHLGGKNIERIEETLRRVLK